MAKHHAVPRGSRRTVNRLSSDDRTTDILSAARAVIARKGYEKTLISDIAREAGVVDGTIYRYFKNKRDLLIKVAEIWFGEQLQVDARMRSTGGTEDKLRHLAWRTLAIIQREPVLARFMLMELRPDPQYKAGPFFEMNRRFTHESLQVCRDAIASGEFNDDVTPNQLRDALHGYIEHRTWAFLRGEGNLNIDVEACAIATLIYRGMRRTETATSAGLDAAIARLEAVSARLERTETTRTPDNTADT
jgi:TetR/AcrR family transcriptional regulator, fatty acid metabolism regulator protein